MDYKYSYCFLLIPFLICQIIGFAVNLAIFMSSIAIYFCSVLVWLSYIHERVKHYISYENNWSFCKFVYYVIFSIYCLAFHIIDNVLALYMTMLFFLTEYIRGCCFQRNSWFLITKINFRIFKSFCFAITYNHAIYVGFNHGLNGQAIIRRDRCCPWCAIWFWRLIIIWDVALVIINNYRLP